MEYKLTGGALKACIAAFSKFQEKIRYYKDRSGLNNFLSKPESYDIKITYDQENYTVYFSPKVIEGGEIKGGGARHIVDGKNYKIMDTLLYK